MAIGIHKPSQGYWVRVITAIVAGMMIAFSCFWAAGQIDALDLPIDYTKADLVSPTGADSVAEGSTIVLERQSRTGGINPFERVGTAIAQSPIVEGNTIEIRIAEIDLGDTGVAPAEIARVRTEDGAFRAETARGLVDVPIISVFRLKAAVIIAIILVFGFLTYFLVGANRTSSEFLIATDGEMKKVHWSTRKEIIGSTWVVVIACFLIAAILFVIDTVFSFFFRLIGVLET